jgi:hypothetical protein
VAKRSASALSKERLRAEGWLVDDVERWIPRINIRKDCFGMFDLIAIRGKGEAALIQVTSSSNVAARVEKIANHENIGRVRECGVFKLLVHGWRENAAGQWVLRVVDVS